MKYVVFDIISDIVDIIIDNTPIKIDKIQIEKDSVRIILFLKPIDIGIKAILNDARNKKRISLINKEMKNGEYYFEFSTKKGGK
jgi:hypothetical protein